MSGNGTFSQGRLQYSATRRGRTWMLPLNELSRKHLVLANAGGDDDIIAVLDLVVQLRNHWKYPQMVCLQCQRIAMQESACRTQLRAGDPTGAWKFAATHPPGVSSADRLQKERTRTGNFSSISSGSSPRVRELRSSWMVSVKQFNIGKHR